MCVSVCVCVCVYVRACACMCVFVVVVVVVVCVSFVSSSVYSSTTVSQKALYIHIEQYCTHI